MYHDYIIHQRHRWDCGACHEWESSWKLSYTRTLACYLGVDSEDVLTLCKDLYLDKDVDEDVASRSRRGLSLRQHYHHHHQQQQQRQQQQRYLSTSTSSTARSSGMEIVFDIVVAGDSARDASSAAANKLANSGTERAIFLAAYQQEQQADADADLNSDRSKLSVVNSTFAVSFPTTSMKTPTGNSTSIIVGIVFAVLLGALAVTVVMVVAAIRHRKRREEKREARAAGDYPRFSTSSFADFNAGFKKTFSNVHVGPGTPPGVPAGGPVTASYP